MIIKILLALVVMLSMPAMAFLERPPKTNVKAVHNAESIVVGSVVSVDTQIYQYEYEGEDGQPVFKQKVVTITEFSVEESISGEPVSPGSTIKIKLGGGEKDGISTPFKKELPQVGDRVIMGISDSSGTQTQALAEFSLKNPRIIPVGENLEEKRDWVERVRSADASTLQKMILDEYKEIGFDYDSFRGVIEDNEHDDISTYDQHETNHISDSDEVAEALDYDPAEPQDDEEADSAYLHEHEEALDNPSLTNGQKVTSLTTGSVQKPSNITSNPSENKNSKAGNVSSSSSASNFHYLILFVVLTVIFVAIFLLVKKRQ